MNNELRIKGLTFFFCIILYSLFFLPTIATAHVLQTDGTIGAVMHIDPNDAPVTGSLSTFIFEFKDQANKFTLSDCTCTVSVIEDKTQALPEKETVYTTSLTTRPLFTYTFIDSAVYMIEIQGKSMTNSFTPFTLTYPIRVEQGTLTTTASTLTGTILYHIIHYGIFILGFVVLSWLVLREKRKSSKKV